jgi:type I restriction enzyme S subunit
MVKGFKNTEVGVIPNDWVVKKIGQCLLKNPDYGINAAAVPFNENLPVYLRITDINEDGNYSKKNLVSVNNISSTSYYLQEGDLVFARTGASVGKTYLYNPKDGKLVFAGFLIRVRANEEILLPNYLKYFTQTKQYWDWIAANSMRTGQPGINGNEYKEISLPLPPTKAEQTAIATALNDADALINQLEQLLTKKQNIKTGAMQEVLKPKDGWEVKKLGEVVDINMGQSPDSKNYNSNQEGLPLLQGNADLDNRKQLIRFWTSQITKVCDDGDIILTVRAPVGSIGIAIQKSCIGRGVCSLKPKSVSKEFIYHLLIFKEKDWKILEQGSTFTSANSNQIYGFEIPIPKDRVDQTRIAQILSDMDNEIQELEKKIEKYKMIKQGMMQNLLTGKIRLM